LVILSQGKIQAQDAPMRFDGPFLVSGIAYEGNEKTKERVLQRELTFDIGDSLGADELYVRLERSRENLLNLGLFSSVGLLPTFLGPTEVFITVTLTERWFWWPSPILRLADPNFNTWWLTKDLRRINVGGYLFRYNMRGLNETLYAKVQLGYSREFGLNYKVPFFDRGQHWGAELGGFYGEQDEITVGTVDNKRVFMRTPGENIIDLWKVQAKVSLRPDHDLRHSWRASWNQAHVRDTVAAAIPGLFRRPQSVYRLSQLGLHAHLGPARLAHLPLSGLFADLLVDRYGLGGTGPDLTTLRGSVQRSWKAGQRWSYGANISGKASLGGGTPYYVQEGLGYDEYVRGYEYYVIDGQHYGLAKFNVLFALVRPAHYRVEPIPFEAFRNVYVAVYLNAFTDVAYVRDNINGENNFLSDRLLRGSGLGLDLVTSYDQVLRVEGAVNHLGETGLYLHFSQPF
jgi:outer membrane protein assembly factor BamA